MGYIHSTTNQHCQSSDGQKGRMTYKRSVLRKLALKRKESNETF